MNFAEAMQALQDGKRVRRKEWPPELIMTLNKSTAYFVTTPDINATDWEIVDEPKPKRKVKMRFYVWEYAGTIIGVWCENGKPSSELYIPTDLVQEIEFEEPEA